GAPGAESGLRREPRLAVGSAATEILSPASCLLQAENNRGQAEIAGGVERSDRNPVMTLRSEPGLRGELPAPGAEQSRPGRNRRRFGAKRQEKRQSRHLLPDCELRNLRSFN